MACYQGARRNLLEFFGAGPFIEVMQISGGASGASYDLAVYKKLQDTTQIEGQQALQLISDATPAVASPTPPPIDPATGRLHIVA